MALRPTKRPPSSRWLKLLAWVGAVLVVLAACSLVGVKMWVNSYLRSPEFRKQIAARTAEHLQAQVEIAPIRFDTSEFFCDGLQGDGARDAKFSDIKVENVRGEFRLPSVWRMIFGDKKFRVESVDVQRVAVNFFPNRLPLDLPQPDKKGKLTEIGRIGVHELVIGWEGGSVSGLSVTGTPVEGGWQVIGDGGRVKQRGVPDLDILALRIVHKEPVLYVQEVKLRAEGGEMTVTGEVVENEKADMQFKMNGVNVTPLLPEDWRARLHGRVGGDGRVQISLRGGTPVPPVVTGHAELQQGVLEALPVLNKIADFTKTDRFRRLILNQLRGDFRYDKDGLHVSNFAVESERLILVKGTFTVLNGEIEGTFDIGITPGPLQWLPGSQEKVFTVIRDGYAWTTMHIAGPVRSPREDLSARLYNAAQDAVVQKVESTATQAVGGAVDTVKKGASGVLGLLFGN
jgi:hypothetical protein